MRREQTRELREIDDRAQELVGIDGLSDVRLIARAKREQPVFGARVRRQSDRRNSAGSARIHSADLPGKSP